MQKTRMIMSLTKNYSNITVNFSKMFIWGTTFFSTVFLAQSAQAALFHFSYQDDNGILSGVLEGNRDGNNLTVNSVVKSFFNGSSTLPINEVFSFDAQTRKEVGAPMGEYSLPTVSFDGYFMDIVACHIQCTNPNLSDLAFGFLFNTTNVLNALKGTGDDSGQPGSGSTTATSGGNDIGNDIGNVIPYPLYSTSGDSFGGITVETFNASGWKLTPIPEPGTVVALVSLGLMGFSRRKKS